MEKCAICGKVIIDNPSKDHYIPKAVYKWSQLNKNSHQYYVLRHTIDSSLNIVDTHTTCNFNKLEHFIKVRELKVTDDKRTQLRLVKNMCQSYIDRYRALKNRVLKKQGYKCYSCKAEIDEDNSSIRRINDRKKRTENNACLVCRDCNRQWFYIRHKFNKTSLDSSVG